MTKYEAEREFYFYKKGTSGSFSTGLFDLIGRADTGNRYLLSVGFPGEVAVWERWLSSEDEQEFLNSLLEGSN